MADLSRTEAEKEIVVVEDEPHSSHPDAFLEGESKILEKEHKENDVSADLGTAGVEQISSSSGDKNIACSSPEKNCETKNTNSKEEIRETSSSIRLSNEALNMDEQELNKNSEGSPMDVPSAEENRNAEDDGSNSLDIRPTEENEIKINVVQGAEIEGSSQPSDHEVIQSLYHIKWIKWKGINTPIITQNENGPCPLIAIINALILQRKLSIPAMQEIISANQLMEYLGDCIFVQAPEVRTRTIYNRDLFQNFQKLSLEHCRAYKGFL
jgi:hypothetical protein